MSKRSSIKTVAAITIAIATAMLLAGCQGGDHGSDAAHGQDAAGESARGPAETSATLELGPEALAILAKADLADGTEDHVVSKCPGCQLAMDGSPDHAARVGDYELHFCSEGCNHRFLQDTEASILALAVEP